MVHLLVQRIRVVWTKASRGAPGAARRNAVPRALPFPTASDDAYVLHHATCLEEAGFTPRSHQRHEDRHRDREGDLRFLTRDGTLHVGFEWSRETGEPQRRGKHDALVLTKNVYGRLTVNGRRNLDVTTYSQDTYNLMLVERISQELFTARAPDREISLEVDLY